MADKELVVGLPKMVMDKGTCASCLKGKQTRQSFPQASMYRATQPLELIHGDLCGPITPSTAAQKRYVFVLIDDFSHSMWTVLLREKNEAFEKFKVFKAQIEQETRASIKTFRTDRGGEFTSNEFQSFCEKNGIKRHLTAPYSPQQNGVVERRNRTLMEMTRSILKHMEMPNYLWGEAVRHSTYLINRVPTRSLVVPQTPYEVLRGRKPNLSHLRVFGCICYARTETVGRKKLDDRSRVLVNLGTEHGSKAYSLLDPTSRRIVISRDVIFDEEKGWNWDGKQGNNTGICTLNFEKSGDQVISGIENEEDSQIGDGATRGMSDTEDHTKVEEENRDGSETEEDDDEQGAPRRSTRDRKKPEYLRDYICLAEIEGERLLIMINE